MSQIREPIQSLFTLLLFQETVMLSFLKYLQESFLLRCHLRKSCFLKHLFMQQGHVFNVIIIIKGTLQLQFHIFLKLNWLVVTTDWTEVLSPKNNVTKIQCTESGTLIDTNFWNFHASKFHIVEFDSKLTSACSFLIEIHIKGQRYLLQSTVRHTGAHFTCTIATLDNKLIFHDEMKPFNEVISSIGSIRHK